MGIVFITGSMEPGKDGVGDYTRRLAGKLVDLGYTAFAIAYNDQFVFQETWETQKQESTEIEVLRLPISLPIKKKMDLARQWIEVLKPDWLSLQYVPFAYQSKGLPVQLTDQLKRIGKGYKWHIMFHELWTGMDTAASLKDRFIGMAQKILISRTIRKMQPLAIHTQSSVYKAQIEKLGYKVKVLPLFGNIPFRKNQPNVRKRNSFIFFGGIHAGSPIQTFAKALSDFMKTNGADVEIWFAGRNGAHLQFWLAVLEEYKIPVKVFGELPADEISSLFQVAHAGLSTTPVPIAQKSGSIAAMLEHEMPVLCIAYSWNPGNIRYEQPELPVTGFNENLNFRQFFEKQYATNKFVNIDDVTNQLLKDLNTLF